MSQLIVITGVTGRQGSSVANTFVNTPGWQVRGITRNSSSDKAKALAAQGVEIVQAELDDTGSLVSAFQGANVIFANTDFFAHVFEGLGSGHATPLKHAYEREVQQGVNLAEAAASHEILQTLDLFIYSALPDLKKMSKDNSRSVYHYDSKVDTINFIKQRFPDLEKRMSLLHLGHYVENWKAAPFLQPQKQDDGSYLFKRTFSPDFKMPYVVAEKDTGPHVKALVDLPPGQNILAVSEYMSLPEWVKLWGQTLGKKTTYEQVSVDELFEGAPEPLKVELGSDFETVQEIGYTGGDPDIKTLQEVSIRKRHEPLHSADVMHLGIDIPLTSMKEYFEQEDWSSVL